MRFHILLFLSLMLAFAACEKDTTNQLVTLNPTMLSGETVTANFYGQLTNDQGNVVAGAAVRIGNKQATTDQEGLWRIANATVVKDQAYVQFVADRHHKGSRTLFVESGSTYEVDVEMLQFTGRQTVDAATGGTVSVPNTDASVTFPAGAFAKTDGTLYTGTVRVETAYLDPNEDSTLDRMPGDLRATTAAGDSRLLITYGMVSVELFDDAGNQLELAADKTATISLPVSGEAANTAPATIPLWYFDEATAQWIEEGSATLQNGKYVGEVSHFTFWNCDIPTDYIRLCGTVVFEGVDSVTAASYLRLLIESQVWGVARGYTDENGQFCGIVPANETLNFSISGGQCNQLLYTVAVGPFASDTDLGTIVVPDAQNLMVNISGTASCNGIPLNSGAVRIYQNGRLMKATVVEPDGTWATTLLTCDTSEMTVQVVNYNTLETSDDILFAFNNVIVTGDIEACSQAITNYFELIIDGNSELGDSSITSVDAPFTIISGSSNNGNGFFGFDLITEELPIPLTVGTHTVVPSPNQEGLYIRSTNLTFGGLRPQNSYDVTITQLPTATAHYTVGESGPLTETEVDSYGTSVTHNIQINFSS